jgi:L-alanine-DL-glutamate epimerase-like enolase superfamily enzyme
MRVDRAELFPLCYPFVGSWKFLDGSPGHTVVLVKLTAEDGTIGWGQSLAVPRWSCETIETVVVVLARYFLPAVIGRDAEDIDGCQDALDRALAPAFSTAMPLARAGVDMALHDLAGKLAGCSLAALWGRPSGGPITLSWTVTARTLEEAEAEVAAAGQRGYRNFNLKIAPRADFDVALAALVRQLAPDSFLWADANCGYEEAAALAVAPKLAEVGVDVLEAPLRPNRLSGYQALKRQGALPITMDEGLISPVEVEEFIKLGMIDGVTAKVSRSGGLASARRQIELALDAGLFFLGSGLTDPDVSLAASLALYSSYGLTKPAALNGPQFLPDDILVTPIAVRGDRVDVPAGPGLGVEVDETKMQRLRMQPTFE